VRAAGQVVRTVCSVRVKPASCWHQTLILGRQVCASQNSAMPAALIKGRTLIHIWRQGMYKCPVCALLPPGVPRWPGLPSKSWAYMLISCIHDQFSNTARA
jgi:hypothetical protein